MANFKDRFRAAGIHFAASLAIAAAAGLLVFGIWFPYPYREISGGRELFTLVVSVDVILGPLITFAIFNRQKPWTELRRDLAIVVAIQLAGLVYGLWTVSMARPVHLVFEIDRFRVIHAVDVPPDMVQMAPADVDPLPLAGPTLLSTRSFRSEAERVAASLDSLAARQGTLAIPGYTHMQQAMPSSVRLWAEGHASVLLSNKKLVLNTVQHRADGVFVEVAVDG